MTCGGLSRAFETVRGYTDPPGYTHPKTGRRFDKLDPEQAAPFWATVQTAPARIAFPDQSRLPVHDSWARLSLGRLRERTRSVIMPAFGHAALGRGVGADQMQAHLHFSGAYGHAHCDSLNLILWAKEREMLPDIGYTWSQMRSWTTSSLGHNLVVVDRQNQNTARSDGNLLQYFPEVEGVGIVEAEGANAYRDMIGLDMYRRMLVMIPVSEQDAYVVDVFRVRGGRIHDWTLHGDATEDTIASTSLALTGERANLLEVGEQGEEPTSVTDPSNPYGMVRDVRSATTNEGFHVEFRYVNSPEKACACTCRPVTSRARCSSDAALPCDAWAPGRPVTCVRLTISGCPSCWSCAPRRQLLPASSRPYMNHSRTLLSSRRWRGCQLTPADDNAVALRVRHGDTTDVIISTLDEPPYPDAVRRTACCCAGGWGYYGRWRALPPPAGCSPANSLVTDSGPSRRRSHNTREMCWR